MKKLLTLKVLIMVLISCNLGTKKPFKNCGKLRPFSYREKALMDSLQREFKSKVNIYRVYYEYRPKYSDCEYTEKEYEISMFNWSNELIFDTNYRRKFAKETAIYLYNNILEDSIKNYIHTFKFSLGNFGRADSTKISVDIFIRKKDVEHYLGKKLVVENNKLVSKRIEKSSKINLIEEINKISH